MIGYAPSRKGKVQELVRQLEAFATTLQVPLADMHAILNSVRKPRAIKANESLRLAFVQQPFHTNSTSMVR